MILQDERQLQVELSLVFAAQTSLGYSLIYMFVSQESKENINFG